MNIALIKETKTPVDNRVVLSPVQVAELNRRFPDHQIVVQTSDIRAYTDGSVSFANSGQDRILGFQNRFH